MKKYTPKQRAAMAAAFRAAKKHLHDGRTDRDLTHFICFAISRAEWRGEVSHGVADLCAELINQRIGFRGSMRAWLREVARVPDHMMTTRRIQQHRHAWLDMLIEEFSS